MKRCPKCNRTFADGPQKFCTHDGGVLVQDVAPTAIFDPNATILTEAPDPFSPQSAAPPPVDDLNKTIAGLPPPTATGDFRRTETGPAIRPTSANLPPAQPSAPSMHPSQPLPGASQSSARTTPPSTSAPLPSTAATTAGPALSPQAAQPASKSKLPWILGGVAILGLLFVVLAAVAYFVVRPRLFASANANTNTNESRVVNTNAGDNANANTNDNAIANASPTENTNAATNENAEANANSNPETASGNESNVNSFVPPPNSVEFINSSAKLDGKLAEHYQDFSFYYPRAWKLDPKSGVAGASNFVKVERLQPPDYTQEQFAVGWYESGGTYEADREKLPKLAEMLGNNYSQNAERFPAYRKVSEGETKVNSYDGYEFRFESISPKTNIKQWGRIVFVPPGVTGEKNGLILLMLATSLAPELSSAEDVGAKGEMPLILESFKIGKP